MSAAPTPPISSRDGGLGTKSRAQTKRPRRRLFRLIARNRLLLVGIIYLSLLGLLVSLEPFLPLPNPTRLDLNQQLLPPSWQHLLGTDENGRDIFARLLDGARISLAVGLAAALLTVAIGTVLGGVAGFFEGAADQIIMRITDGLMSIPLFFLVLTVVTIFGSSAGTLILVLAFTRWMEVARVVRSEVIRHRHLEFVAAAHSLGASDAYVLKRHVLPQALPSIIVATSLAVGTVILTEAGLSFLGLGITPPTPSLGNMLTNSYYYVWSAPHLTLYPGLMILMTVLAFNSVGDAVRDLLDPRYAE
jgi:peptide/nickel transport system permease protein